MHVTCSKCHTSNSLTFFSGPIASSFTAETFALKQGLDWCTNHLLTCKFQSFLFLTDSQSGLSILSSAPSYLLPESLWNVWSLASSLSNNITLNFQWVPGHADLPGNKNADLLAKAGTSLPADAIPCPLPPVIAKIGYLQYHSWRRHISHSYLNCQVPKVSSEELLLSRPICCELSRLRCHGHSLLLSSYLDRISRKENSACSACRHPLQELNHLLLDCPASEPLRKSIFGSSLFLSCGPDLGVWPDYWVSAEFLRTPIPRKGSGSTTTILDPAILFSQDLWAGTRKIWAVFEKLHIETNSCSMVSGHIAILNPHWIDDFVIFTESRIRKLFLVKLLLHDYAISSLCPVLRNTC